ncbi:ComEA family DNA-binding protein [Geothrix fuzhouensis]|uniref:ComEA family DNA-binding protein n=1 Tax=Geothrix fuzhouensis TaxID=2966451 RepID=UPI002147B76F|nr:helix-hairpin-helix domain-containing protein [Geothrix fuzhouensis]
MTKRLIRTFLGVAMLLPIAGLPMAAQSKPIAKSQAPATTTRAKGKLKPVDINSATRNELGFMLGISEELAAKIVAGRPYRSKAHLLTHHIVSAEVYAKIKDKVVAKQSAPVR